jgi:hypothetical protein
VQLQLLPVLTSYPGHVIYLSIMLQLYDGAGWWYSIGNAQFNQLLPLQPRGRQGRFAQLLQTFLASQHFFGHHIIEKVGRSYLGDEL